MEGGGFEASFELVLDAAPFFGLPSDEARGLAREMAQTIIAHWRQALRNEGVSAKDIRLFSAAFEHAEMEMALGL